MGTPVAAKLSAATGVSGIPTWIMICAMVVLVASLGATAWRRGLLQFGVNAPGLAATLNSIFGRSLQRNFSVRMISPTVWRERESRRVPRQGRQARCLPIYICGQV